MTDEWNSYLQYLKDWVENHRERDFYGSSPACFDEWADNECLEEVIGYDE